MDSAQIIGDCIIQTPFNFSIVLCNMYYVVLYIIHNTKYIIHGVYYCIIHPSFDPPWAFDIPIQTAKFRTTSKHRFRGIIRREPASAGSLFGGVCEHGQLFIEVMGRVKNIAVARIGCIPESLARLLL